MIPFQEYFFHRKRCTLVLLLNSRRKGRRLSVHRTVRFHPSSLGKCAKKEQILSYLLYGAGDEARTRYLHLGKVALYQMSYARNGHGLL